MLGVAMAQTALADRYRDLGFRVVEGGKSNKLAILRTPAVAEIFGKRHDHVLGDIREYREILSPNLGQGFIEHCRPTTYRARDGKDQPCFELTKVGFSTVATKYDPTLRFLLALGFDALECADDGAQASVLGQINKRIAELRSRATGQNELDLSAPDRTLAPELITPINDAAKVRPPAHPNAHNAYKRETWLEEEDGFTYPIIRERNHNGDVADIFFERIPTLKTSTDGYQHVMPWINGSTVTLHLNHIIPLAVVERVYLNQLPDGKVKDTARMTLDFYLAV
jgi:hypothetical protein